MNDRPKGLCLPSLLKTPLLLGTLLLIAISGIAQATPNNAEKYALLIGIDDYAGTGFLSLDGAKNDIHLMESVLTNRFDFPNENITLLLDSDASHEGILNAISELAEKAKPGDMVYIHYSGHGSYTCDLNGDEPEAHGLDSTWVSHGSRSGLEEAVDSGADCAPAPAPAPAEAADTARHSLDQFDVLDDEIHNLVARLNQVTDNVILVSDSCHSGTITRGKDAFKTRGLPRDHRAHPAGRAAVSNARLEGVRVSASRDTEKASEYEASGERYGMFTWFWAQSLQNAETGDTWRDVFLRAQARLENEFAPNSPQHPQIEGEFRRVVFGGEYAPAARTIPVVSAMGPDVIINAGHLTGVTPGSVYVKYGSGAGAEQPATIEITSVGPTTSFGEATGSFAPGELVVLDSYEPAVAPMRVYIGVEHESDADWGEKLRSRIENLPAFEIVQNQAESDIVLYVFRPAKGADGAPVYANPAQSLPDSDPEARLECWVLAPDESLYFAGQDRLKMALTEQRLTAVVENLRRIAKINNLVGLSAGPGEPSPVRLQAVVWERTTPADKREIIDFEGHLYAQVRTVDIENLDFEDLKVGNVLTFRLTNESDTPYYTYLIDIMESGEIIPFFPLQDLGVESSLVPAHASLNTEKYVSLEVDTPGREYIRLIVSRDPIDIYVLEQGTFRGAADAPTNALESLLSASVGATRGKPKRMHVRDWATTVSTFRITP